MALIYRKKIAPDAFLASGAIFLRVLSDFYKNAMVKPAITILTIDINLMRILSDGPEVSLNGSPTVSPTIVAL